MWAWRRGFGLAAAARVAWVAAIFVALAVQLLADSPGTIGSWKVEISFPNGESRSIRFDAAEGGKGSFQLLDPRSNAWGSTKPVEAKWTHASDASISFSGPMEFPLGNIGRDPGTLVFKGTLHPDATITGEVEFSHLASEQPPKKGAFKAVRTSGD